MVGGRIETSAAYGSLVARAISPPHVSRCEGACEACPHFCPLFDKYHIDIALESDGHCMKRTAPIRHGKKDPTGIVYVGEGGLGVGQRKRWQSVVH